MEKRLMLFLTCLIMSVGLAIAQTQTVKGHVTSDEDGLPVVGASVLVTGTTIGTITDLDGNFTLGNVPSSAKTLQVSYVGTKTQEVAIKSNMRIVLKADSELLDEVVVVAYGTAKKESLVGAISSMSAKELSKRPVTNVGAALEGAASGLRVNSSTSQPGEAPTIRIRGFSSVSGNMDPLIILDGVTFVGSFSDINPNDIENVSVLKDASATALYGSRAANGVILITTKRGRAGAAGGSINLMISQGFTRRASTDYKKLGANNYMQVMFDGLKNQYISNGKTTNEAIALANSNLIPEVLGYNIYNIVDNNLFTADGVFNPEATILQGIAGDLNWFKDMERTGYRQEYNLSGSSATEKLKAYYSLGYMSEDGYLKFSDFYRYTGRMNMSYDARKWLRTGLNLSTTYSKRSGVSSGSDNNTAYVNPIYFARFMSPIYPVHLHDLTTGDFILDELGKVRYDVGDVVTRPQNNGRHTIWENELNDKKYTNYRFSIQPFIDITLPYGLKYSVKADLSIRHDKRKEYANPIVGDGAGVGRLIVYDYDYKEYSYNQNLLWNYTFNKIHNVEALIGHEAYSWGRDYTYLFKQGQAFDGLKVFDNFATTNSLSGHDDAYRMESYLARAKYNYAEKYFLETSVRKDRSSIFHPDHRWGTFWSVGGSWIATKEKFLEDMGWLDMLKIRVSYGQVGNDGFGSSEYYTRGTSSEQLYLYQSLYGLDTYGDVSAVYRTQLADKGISWETKGEFTTGVDIRLFNRLNLVVDFFNMTNKDLLFDVTRPLSAGSTNTATAPTTVKKNIGTVRNRGLELTADMDVITNNAWTWNIGANVTFLKNEITKLPEEMRAEGYITGTKKWMEGKSIYEFFLYKWAGIDQLTGDGLYYLDETKKATAEANGVLKTINGVDYTTNFSYGLRDFSGSAIPDAFGSLSTSLRYKDLTLSVLCTYGIGGKMLDNQYASLISISSNPNAIHKDALKAWKTAPEGMTEDSSNRVAAGIPIINYNHSSLHTSSSDRHLVNASYFSIKNIALLYNFPNSVTRSLGLGQTSIGATFENIAFFTKRKGLNPQQSFSGVSYNNYLPTRVGTLTLNVTF